MAWTDEAIQSEADALIEELGVDPTPRNLELLAAETLRNPANSSNSPQLRRALSAELRRRALFIRNSAANDF